MDTIMTSIIIEFISIQWGEVVYPSKEILLSKSSLYEDIYKYSLSDDYVNEDNDHIYNKYAETNFDSMSGYVEYKIYKLKIV